MTTLFERRCWMGLRRHHEDVENLNLRDLSGLSPYRTPLGGFYLERARTFPGGAVHGVPADAAARAVVTQV